MQGLRVRVLGGFEVEGVDTPRLGSRKARTVLKVLTLARSNPVPVDALSEAVWPDMLPARPSDQLSVLVSRLRSALGPQVLLRSDGGYALAVEWLDLDEMATLVEEARVRLNAGNATTAAVAAGAAIALARGPLLPDDIDSPWAEIDRALAVRMAGAARRLGAEAALASGDFGQAVLLAQGALDEDQFDEPSLQTLMVALARSGRPASALAAYAEMRRRLAEELGVDPTAQTEDVHGAILRAESLPGAPGPPTVGPDATGRPAAPTPPGREDAVATLDRALSAATEGRGGLVTVTAEAGMGKSHLVDAWAARTAPVATVLVGRCDERSRATPLRAIIDALEEHLRRLAPGEGSAVLGADAEFLRPFMAPVVETNVPVPVSALRDWGGGQLVAFAALLSVLTRLPAPTVLVLDDLHLAGSATLEWIDYAARRAESSTLLLVATQRREEAVPLSASVALELGPLDEVAAAQIVGPERAPALFHRSGGNPLFLVELATSDSDDDLPRSIREAVMARCERAGPAAANTLCTAAVIGQEVDLDLLSAVLRVPPIELLDHLEEGARRSLLVDRGGRFEFRHQLVREALVESTGAARRALVHRETGRALVARPSHDAYAVALHARLGGDAELAATSLLRSAELASARFDQTEALKLADAAVDASPSVPAFVLRARVRMMLGDYLGSADDARQAVSLGAGAVGLELEAWSAHYRREFGEAARLADEGAARAERDADADARSACLTIGGWVRQATGDLPGAEDRFSRAHAGASEEWRAVASLWLGVLRVHQGRMEEGLELLRPAMAGSGVAPWGSPTAHALLFGAQAQAHLGHPIEALAAVDALEAEQARTGIVRWAGRAENTRGWILRNLGEAERADELNLSALERASAIDLQEAMSHAHLDLAAGAILRGDLEFASRSVDAARGLGDRQALTWRHRMRADLYSAQIALAGGDPEGALRGGNDVVASADAMGVARHTVLAQLVVARARRRLGQHVDLEGLDTVVQSLGRVAGLEAWWLTAEVAAAFGIETWWKLAEQRAVALAATAGPYADAVRRFAGARLDKTRSSNTNG